MGRWAQPGLLAVLMAVLSRPSLALCTGPSQGKDSPSSEPRRLKPLSLSPNTRLDLHGFLIRLCLLSAQYTRAGAEALNAGSSSQRHPEGAKPPRPQDSSSFLWGSVSASRRGNKGRASTLQPGSRPRGVGRETEPVPDQLLCGRKVRLHLSALRPAARLGPLWAPCPGPPGSGPPPPCSLVTGTSTQRPCWVL